jgi:hypothetical protein
MCFANRVKGEEKYLKKVKRTRTAYKIFVVTKEGLTSLFYKEPFKRENFCNDIFSDRSTHPGFYCYIYKRDAVAVMRKFRKRHSVPKYAVKKVIINEVLCIGICAVIGADNEPTAPVITTDSIYIPDLV